MSEGDREGFASPRVSPPAERSMIERVARAIQGPLGCATDDALFAAKRAIEAMREPTREIIEVATMVEVGSAWIADMGSGYKEGVTFPIGICLSDTGCRDISAAILAIWRDMVDASLKLPNWMVREVASRGEANPNTPEDQG